MLCDADSSVVHIVILPFMDGDVAAQILVIDETTRTSRENAAKRSVCVRCVMPLVFLHVASSIESLSTLITKVPIQLLWSASTACCQLYARVVPSGWGRKVWPCSNCVEPTLGRLISVDVKFLRDEVCRCGDALRYMLRPRYVHACDNSTSRLWWLWLAQGITVGFGDVVRACELWVRRPRCDAVINDI